MSNTTPETGFQLGSKTYDKMKRLSMYIIPALGAAYFSLAQLWDLPKAEEVVGTTTIIGTFLGVVLGISNKNYQAAENTESDAGILAITGYDPDTGNPDLQVTMTKDPVDLADRNKIVLHVDKQVDVPPRNFSDELPPER